MYSQLLLPKKGKRKKPFLVSRKLTTTSEKRVDMTDVLISLKIRQRPETLHLSHAVGATGSGLAGGGAGGPGALSAPGTAPSRAPLSFLKGAFLYARLFPGITALDINESRSQLAVINAELHWSGGSSRSPGGGGRRSHIHGSGTNVRLRGVGEAPWDSFQPRSRPGNRLRHSMAGTADRTGVRGPRPAHPGDSPPSGAFEGDLEGPGLG